MPSVGTKIIFGIVRIVTAIGTHPVVHFVALLGLCAAYLQGGVTKLLDFDGAVVEAQHFGLKPAVLIAAATIITEFCGPALNLKWQVSMARRLMACRVYIHCDICCKSILGASDAGPFHG